MASLRRYDRKSEKMSEKSIANEVMSSDVLQVA
jgi:hypothetical protein